MHVCMIKNKAKAKRGQLSIIAALLFATIMVAAVITTYSRIRNIPFQNPPKILGAIDGINSAIKNILGFTVGYYGSILQVTGNAEYAKTLTSSYLRSGFINLARIYPESAPSFEIESPNLSTLWFATTSYSLGNVSTTYSLPGAGIFNVTYRTSSLLNVTILEPLNLDEARIHVTGDEEKPDLTLGKNNFFFYLYSYSNSTWEGVHPSSDPIAFSNGTYVLDIPPEVDPTTYIVKVVDQRGIMVIAFFSQSRCSQYTYTFTWDEEKYGDLTKDTIVVEVLQNGALRWLGQDLELSPEGRPILPIPVKAFRVNQTVNGVNREVPFQIEDWASNYRVPLGLSVNTSLFSSKNMIVFLVNHNVSDVTLWWDGRDTAAQTSYATESNLNDKVFEAEERATLNNDIITVDIMYGDGDFRVETATSTAEFMRINGESARYFAAPSFVILNGTVRDIIQQEGEWAGQGAPNSPNVYSQIVLTLPANATYYTYALRTFFVNSSSCPANRNLSDLSPIQLSSELVLGLQSFTENGTSGGFPLINETIGGQTNLFYNFSTSTGWAHHWSEYISGNNGGGIMFPDTSNLKLYAFDSIAGDRTGALSMTTQSSGGSGSGSYSFSSDVPFGTPPTGNTGSLDATGGYMIIGDGTADWGSVTGTISFWIKWDTVAGRPWGQHNDMEARFSGSNLVLDWGGTSSLTSTTSFTAGKWYFIAIVWNESTDNLYLYVGDQSNPPTLDAQNNVWASTVSDEGVTQNNFMASKGGVGPTDGHGDDLRYWNTDRSITDIQSDYDTELAGSETNLRSYFKLNNNFYNTGRDASIQVTIEFNPVERFSVAFTDPKDIIWCGAVVTFTDEYDPIWVDGNTGLWVMVEHPPTVSVG